MLSSQGVDYRQGSAELGIFLNYPKNTLPLTENPKKYFPKSKTLKNTLKNTYSFRKSQAWYDNNGDPWLLKHLVNETGPRKIQLKIWNTLKYIFYLTTPKIQQLWLVPKKIQIPEIQNPKKFSADPCL